MSIGSRPNTTDVYIQDQVSPTVDVFLTRKLGTATLAAPTTFDARTITLAAGHGFTTSDMIEISDDSMWFYQSRVKTVVGDVITVNNPLCHAFPITATVNRTNHNMNINASASPVLFTAHPPLDTKWDINILSVNMLDDVVMDDAKFGGITALSNGVIFRTVNAHCSNIFNALDNGCFLRHCDTEYPYSDKAPAGLYGFNAKRHFNGQNGDGVARRIGGDEVSEFQAVVNDDLSGLVRFWCVLRGHVVIDPVPGTRSNIAVNGNTWTAITVSGQSATLWTLDNTTVMIASSETGAPSMDTAYPVYRHNILDVEADSLSEVFYAKCINAGETAKVIVDVIG